MAVAADYLMSLMIYNREGLTIDADISLPAERVIRSLEQIIEWRGKPKRLRCVLIVPVLLTKLHLKYCLFRNNLQPCNHNDKNRKHHKRRHAT